MVCRFIWTELITIDSNNTNFGLTQESAGLIVGSDDHGHLSQPTLERPTDSVDIRVAALAEKEIVTNPSNEYENPGDFFTDFKFSWWGCKSSIVFETQTVEVLASW